MYNTSLFCAILCLFRKKRANEFSLSFIESTHKVEMFDNLLLLFAFFALNPEFISLNVRLHILLTHEFSALGCIFENKYVLSYLSLEANVITSKYIAMSNIYT